MKQFFQFLRHTGRSIRRHAARLISKIRHRATIKVGVTMFLPPVFRVSFEYVAELRKPDSRP